MPDSDMRHQIQLPEYRPAVHSSSSKKTERVKLMFNNNHMLFFNQTRRFIDIVHLYYTGIYDWIAVAISQIVWLQLIFFFGPKVFFSPEHSAKQKARHRRKTLGIEEKCSAEQKQRSEEKPLSAYKTNAQRRWKVLNKKKKTALQNSHVHIAGVFGHRRVVWCWVFAWHTAGWCSLRFCRSAYSSAFKS